jgi:hypothetical protein
MDRQLKELIEKLKAMSSEDASTWLMETYPLDSIDYGNAIILLPHRSWMKPDQLRLARYYFQKIPFASKKPYEAFASFMSISNLIKIIREYIPTDQSDKELLKYYLEGVLKKGIKSGSDKELVKNFIDEIG